MSTTGMTTESLPALTLHHRFASMPRVSDGNSRALNAATAWIQQEPGGPKLPIEAWHLRLIMALPVRLQHGLPDTEETP